MKILVANVGSTSFKYKLFDMTDETVLAEGRLERIGGARCPVHHRIGTSETRSTCALPDYPSAIRNVMEALGSAVGGGESADLDAVGFKTVHLRGEPGTYVLDDGILERMADYNDLAPAHNPPYIQAVRIFRALYPDLPLIGLFEPAFHATIPDYAYTYSVPFVWYETYGVRKYGFHGASHRYVSESVPRLLDRPADGLKLISCHLGGSASLCAIKDGRSIDTTMGFSAQDGIIHGNRNGAIDPFIIPFIMDRENLSTDDVRRILTMESGLAGISGLSGDVRDLETAADAGNRRARLAIETFCYGVKTAIGAMAAALGGVDALAFAGGIGERGVRVRRRICRGLEFLGIELDPGKNRDGVPERLISASESAVKIAIVTTNEEIIVARETAALVTRTS
ncbi:MAG: acetate/propionate family kinase [Gemmatimonadota bacterium]|nr:acetate/propionate family kinase [Gemmatimonadota bacterium]